MDKLKKIVGKIKCGGSCFFIDKKHILTARHCLEDKNLNEDVEVTFNHFPEVSIGKLILKLEAPLDFAIIKIETEIETDFLPLVNDVIINGEAILSYGYPEGHQVQGRIIEGKVIDSTLVLPERDEGDKNNFDLKISSQEISITRDNMAHGFSGSPLVIDAKIVGIIKNTLGDGVGVQKISNFLEILEEYNIKYETMSTFRKKIIDKAMEEVDKNKESKKYIPGVHIELNSIKDKIRYFCDPILFYTHVIEKLKRLDFNYSNETLKKLNLSPIEFNVSLEKVTSLEGIPSKIELIEVELKDKIEYMKKLRSREVRSIFPQINKDEYKIHEGKLLNGYLGSDFKVKKKLENLNFFTNNILFVLDTAGRGKTTLLCDFVENSLKNKEQLTFFIAALRIIRGDFTEFFKREILDLFDLSLKKFLEIVNETACKDNKPALIIIDGLNESENYKDLSITLENFMSILKQYPNIKLILTSRTEYFEERFRNLNILSNSTEVSSIRDVFNFRHNDILKEKAISKYLDFFNIKGEVIGRDVTNEFLNNPLLLRFFCEAYKDKEIFEVHNLYKYNLFLEYTKNKIKTLKDKGYDHNLFLKGLHRICEYMVTNNKYFKVPLDSFGDKAIIKEIIHEDVIFREDIIVDQGPGGDEVDEVISFTFDEYRDYHLAWYLYTEKGQTIEELFKAVNQLNDPNLPIQEGVTRYIYFILKMKNRKDILEKIEGMEWTIEPFLEYIFSVDEDKITDEDIDILFNIFSTSSYTKKIFEHLIANRRNNKKVVNFNLIFEFIKQMSTKNYIKNVLSIYREKQGKYYSNNYSDRDSVISELVETIKEKFLPEEAELAYKLMLVLALTPENYNPSYEANELLEELHLELKSRTEEIIHELKVNCVNRLFVIVLERIEKNGEIGYFNNYLFNLQKIVSSNNDEEIYAILDEMDFRRSDEDAEKFIKALTNGTLEFTEWEDI